MVDGHSSEGVPAATAAPRCELRPPRVLFADGSPTQRLLAEGLLSDRYRLQTVGDGRAALDAIRADPPDVIVADSELPALTGLELLEAVKAEAGLRRIPFILVTTGQLHAIQSLEAGADDYLPRPVGPVDLRARVAAAVRSRRMVAELERQHAEMIRIHEDSRQLELELHQAQKLEAVGRLAAGIAHEINTPIQFIGDNTRFLQDAFQGLVAVLAAQREALAALPVPAELAERLARAAEEADLVYTVEQVPRTIERTLEGTRRVAVIVRAMKEFAHPDQREMVATDLNRALLATVEVARNEYKYVAEVETVLDELPLVTCYPGDLNQVFLNLLVNAAHAIDDVVKGTGAKGRIRIATARRGDAVEIAIADTGAGIPEAIREKIFEPFFTTKEVGRGTGQGLAIARSVVEKHRGTIAFETEVGRGTTFRIRIPIGGAPAPAEAA